MRRAIVGTAAALLLVLGTMGTALAAPNPGGTGQPGQSCGSAGATSMPAGFNTDGFTHAADVYAGSPGTPSAANGSSQAVSQYDVACFQVTSSGH